MYNDEEILKLWDDKKAEGVTMSELAKQLGYKGRKSLDSRITRARKRLRKKGDNRPNRQAKTEDLPPEFEGEEELKDEEDGNYRDVILNSRRIKTLDDLIESAKIDLNVWRIEGWKPNTWEVGAKVARKSLQYTNGVVDGFIEDPGKLSIETLYQVKATCVRIKPIAIEPVVQPIQIQLSIPEPPKAERINRLSRLKRALLIFDMHFGFRRDIYTGELAPFHDRAVMDLVLQIAGLDIWDAIVFGGDAVDLTEWSDRFLRSPEFYWATQPAIIELTWWLGKIVQAASSSTKRVLIPGNHEARMESSIVTHLAAAYKLKPATELHLPPSMSVPRLLSLHTMGIEWPEEPYPEAGVWLNDKLFIEHGNKAKAKPGQTASDIVMNSQISKVGGHIHRRERADRTHVDRYGSREITYVVPGCACRIDYTVPGHKKTQNWQQGIAVAYYDDEEYSTISIVEIHEGEAVFEGQLFNAQNRLDQIIEETHWKF